jgi:UDP:flavonoid glycosyltransferase YjiC (YdhE family)
LRSIPYITICDAYWSPERPLHPPLPVLPFTRFAPIPLAKFVFGCVAPFAMRLHAVPLERLRKRFGLPSLGYDLRRCYTDADLRLFANFPALFPEVTPSAKAAFIGPLAWSPAPGGQLDFLATEEPLIYVTMGSSGNPRVLETLVPILEATGHQVIVATAGKLVSEKLASAKTRVFDFVPGELLCRRAKLVVCNGGSPTTNQALSSGAPVLGIAQNMDQFLNMQTIEAFGAGIMVRGDRAREQHLQGAVSALLSGAPYEERARLLARSALELDSGAELIVLIDRLLSEDKALRSK